MRLSISTSSRPNEIIQEFPFTQANSRPANLVSSPRNGLWTCFCARVYQDV